MSPKYLIRDNDSKFGVAFARVAQTSGIKILKTPFHAKRPNAICERFLGSVRRECLDHLLILQEKQVYRILRAYVQYFNQARPQEAHQAADSRAESREQCQYSMQAARSSPSRSWADCIVTIDEAHKFFQIAEEKTAETAECLRVFINMEFHVIFGATWNKQGRWMLSGA